MNHTASYVLVVAVFSIPLLMLYFPSVDIILQLFMLTSAVTAPPWP